VVSRYCDFIFPASDHSLAPQTNVLMVNPTVTTVHGTYIRHAIPNDGKIKLAYLFLLIS